MAVDYADKGKPKRKNTKRAGAPGPKRSGPGRGGKKKPARPVGLLVVALVIIGLFVGGLYWLKGKSSGPDSPVVFTDNAKAQNVERDALPEAPREQWGYIEDLENHEVEVIIPERAESRRRLMQCGSFRSESDAQTLRARIAMAGYEAQVRSSESAQHGVWYRVILGPFDNLRAAQTVNNQLRRTSIHGCQIWYWNLD